MSLSCCALSKWELFILRLVLLHHIKDLLCAYFFRWTLSSILCSLHDSSKPCIIVVLFLFSVVFVTEPFCRLIEPNNTICSIKLLFWSKLPQRRKLVQNKTCNHYDLKLVSIKLVIWNLRHVNPRHLSFSSHNVPEYLG